MSIGRERWLYKFHGALLIATELLSVWSLE